MFWFFSEKALESAREFAESGEQAQAVAMRSYTERERAADGDLETVRYIELEFTTRAGEPISLNRRVSSSEFRRIKVGDEITIVYLRDRPRVIEVTPGSNLRAGRQVRRLAWLSFIPAIVSALVFLRTAVDGYRAQKYGQRLEVKVVEIRKPRWWINQRGYRLIWRDDMELEQKSLSYRAHKLMGFRVGDTITVFQGNKRSWWAGDVGDNTAQDSKPPSI